MMYQDLAISFSAFDFESDMNFIKKFLRKSEKLLQQIVNRTVEGRFLNKYKTNLNIQTSQEHFGGLLLPSCKPHPQFKMLTSNNFTLKLNTADSYIQLHSNDIVHIYNIVHSLDNEIVILGKIFLEKKPFFSKPCESTNFGIFEVDENMSSLKMFQLSEIKCKIFYVPIETNCALI